MCKSGFPTSVELVLISMTYVLLSIFKRHMILSNNKGRDILDCFSSRCNISIQRNLSMSPSSVSTNFSFPYFNDWILPSILLIDGTTIMQSSTYVSMTIPFAMYKHRSMFDALNYLSLSVVLISSYKLNDACFTT